VKGTPILTIIGDNAKDHPRWKNIRNNSVVYAEAFKAAGGDFTFVDLPDAGLKGNSHMMMMDKNSDEIAALIQKWLVAKGLSD
jgi:acyl CoA:acetate/3-ketoacid CoA transferase alpha subunit